jgi:hypothetical protein
MDVENELNAILNDVLDLPLEWQEIVVEDILESAKNRVATMKRLIE